MYKSQHLCVSFILKCYINFWNVLNMNLIYLNEGVAEIKTRDMHDHPKFISWWNGNFNQFMAWKNFQFAKNGQIYKSFTLRDLIAWYSHSQLEIFVQSMYNYDFKTLFLPILTIALDQTKRKGNVFANVIEYDISHWFLSNYIL